MTALDALLSGCALALTILLAVLALRDAVVLPQGRALAVLALSVSAQALAALPLVRMLPAAYIVARILGAPNVGLLWWFCLVLLRDDFRWRGAEWAGLCALSIAPLTYLLADIGVPTPMPGAVSIYGSIAPLVMVVHVVWVALRERGADLLEPRRRARVWIVGACLLALVVSLATEEMRDGQLASILRNALVGVPVAAFVLMWLTSLRTERLQFIHSADAPAVVVPVIDPRDIALHQRLLVALESERCFLQPGLSIDALADQLRTPVQPLRLLINAGLGHRNFTSFVNHYRLGHAKSLLAKPERARSTVLSIALDSGFASLATFNRVFRDVEGCTPTEYRAAALAKQVSRKV